jgi:salicylate 5-hydroxylase large subunit
MNAPSDAFHTTKPLQWYENGTSRIPFRVYTDSELHTRELENFFYKNHWCYVGDWRALGRDGAFGRR